MATLLIVEENLAAAVSVSDALKTAGYQALIALSVGQAKLHLSSRHVDLLLCDAAMLAHPDLSALLPDPRARASASQDMPIIAMSHERKPAMRGAADGVLVKPVQTRDLLAMITSRLAPASAPVGQGGTGGRILVVEDDVELLDEMRSMLLEHGYDPVCATNLERACTLIDTCALDGVIADVLLPDSSDDQLLRPGGASRLIRYAGEHARTCGRALPVLVISGGFAGGSMAQVIVDTAILHGAALGLAKPFDSGALLSALNQLLQGVRADVGT